MGLYIGKIGVLLAGCICLGLGIALEVIPDVLILPGEGLVRAIAQRSKWDFGNVKTCFDLSLVISAAALSYFNKGEILGIREGTIVAAFTIGTISHFFIIRITTLLERRGNLLLAQEQGDGDKLAASDF